MLILKILFKSLRIIISTIKMSTYYIELPSDTTQIVSMAYLRKMALLPENICSAIQNLLADSFNMKAAGVYLPGFIYFTLVDNTIASVAFVKCETYSLIYNACTSPYYRRRGLMSELLKIITANFKNHALYLQVQSKNTNAYRLYQKVGFSPVNITEEIITMQYN